MRFDDDEKGDVVKVGVPLLRSSSAASFDTHATEERSMSMASSGVETE